MDEDNSKQPDESTQASDQSDVAPVDGVPANVTPPEVGKEAKKFKLKKMHMYVAAGILLVTASVAVMATTLSNQSDEASNSGANGDQQTELQLASAITIVEGTVEHSVDGESWRAVSGGETVAVGEYVRTLADGRAVVLLDDGSAVRLDASTRMQLTAADASLSEVTLHDGQVYTRVVESDSRTFAVVTSSDRFEALGTAYKTSTDDQMDSVEVYQSKVKVDSDGTEVEEGNKYDTDTREKSSIDLDKLKDDDFLQWNKQQDSEDEDFKDLLGVLGIDEKDEEADEPAPVDTTPTPGVGITLSGSQSDKGVALSWSTSGVSAPDGFKVVFDKSDSTPSYKENSAHYVGSDARSHVVDVDDGKLYYFRVCIYRAASGSCDTYSNSVSAQAPLVETEPVVAGAVTLGIEDRNINWSFAGTAPHGFKVVLSSSPQPVYPANSIKYLGPENSSYALPEKPAGTYYVRVCKYTADAAISGGCTDYSNQVEYVVAEE